MRRFCKSAAALFLALCLLFCYACSVDVPGDDPTDPPQTEEPAGDVSDPGAPTIAGAEDKTIAAGTYFDPLSGVTAVAQNGEDVTAALNVSGALDTSRTGIYTLHYTAADAQGRTARKARKITVTDNPMISYTPPVYLYTAEEAYNIAEGCAAAASSENGAAASLAADGDGTTRWESDWVASAWLQVDLGAVVPVESFTIRWEAAYARDFEVQLSSDGTNFTAAETVTDWAPSESYPTWSYTLSAAQSARYVRLYMTERAMPAYGYSVYELEVYGKQGTVMPESEYPVLFDARDSGGWDWSKPCDEWLQVDFGTVRSIDYMELSFRNWLTPAAYAVRYSSDGDVWEELSRDGAGNILADGQAGSVSARYVRVEISALTFRMNAVRINQILFRSGGAQLDPDTFSVTASSETEGHGAEYACALDNYTTYWESEYSAVPQTIDLGSVQAVGRADLYWDSANGGSGKYYDLQISENGTDFTTVFRQTHGAEAAQSVYIYESARYLRIVDYGNGDTLTSCSAEQYDLQGIVVQSQLPNESKVDYDVTAAFPQQQVYELGAGSYTGDILDYPAARLVAYLVDSLRDRPIPSNDWWQSLLITNGGNAMYLNPLVADFTAEGLWLTNPGEGYFSGTNPGNGRQTIDVNERDLCIGYAGMGADVAVRVTGYSDYGISAVMTDVDGADKLTVWMQQGGAYAYFLFADSSRARISAGDLVGVFDLSGDAVLSADGASYTGDCIVVCVRSHSGYEGGTESSGQMTWQDRYYVLNFPAETKITRADGALYADMTQGNYLSVGAMTSVRERTAAAAETAAAEEPDAAEAALFHEHGYAFVLATLTGYSVDDTSNIVHTDYLLRTWLVREGFSSEALSAYLPHQYKIGGGAEDTGFSYASVRGDCKLYIGNSFRTEDRFYGVVPQFALPDDDGFSSDVLYAQLLVLYENVGGDAAPEDSNLINGDPYWQGKNLHPMAMAVLAADQLGATDLRDAFLEKIRFVLEDWFTYSESEPNDAYLYYDSEWGTLYYKNSEFGANTNLADHHFTYGYLTLAAGVLCAYDRDFLEQYGGMVELLIRDYMNPSRTDGLFPYMRNFDVFAGHSWAGGYADNDGGNNQESAGEALNSWVGAYLYAVAAGDETIKDAAIYGYTTELAAIKQYWFNYGGDSFSESYPYGAIGQLYGASNFFGTFFNGEPLYIYGIHLLPGEEFLTSYGMTDAERAALAEMIASMEYEQANWGLSEESSSVHAWQHIFIPIVSVYDADEAIAWYEELGGDVGNANEQFNVYYFMHAMKSLGVRTTEVWAENGLPATVYKDGSGAYTAICWNPTEQAMTFTFRSEEGVTGSASVPAGTLAAIDPFAVTQSLPQAVDCGELAPDSYYEAQNVSQTAGGVAFENGSAEYLVSFGESGAYRTLRIEGMSEVRAYLDGEELTLTEQGGAYVSGPIAPTFRHILRIEGGGTLTGLSFAERAFAQIDLSGAVATASSDNKNEHVAGHVTDGDAGTRWESEHEVDPQWLEIELASPQEIYRIEIDWETASAAAYEVFFSEDGEKWTSVFSFSGGTGARTDTVTPSAVFSAGYIRINMTERSTQYGYSVYEVRLYGLEPSAS